MPKPLTKADFKPITPRKRGIGSRTWLAFGFSLALAALYGFGRLPLLVPGVYGVVSVAASGYYAYDKFAAKSGRWRIPEKTLHLLSLAGGWPGALIAQEWIRHKSIKTSFQITFWITVLLNCGLLGWILLQNPEDIAGIIQKLSRLKI